MRHIIFESLSISGCTGGPKLLVMIIPLLHTVIAILNAVSRTQGEAGTGNVVEAVRHCRAVVGAIKQLKTLDEDELYVYAKELRAPIELVQKVKELGRYAAL